MLGVCAMFRVEKNRRHIRSIDTRWPWTKSCNLDALRLPGTKGAAKGELFHLYRSKRHRATSVIPYIKWNVSCLNPSSPSFPPPCHENDWWQNTEILFHGPVFGSNEMKSLKVGVFETERLLSFSLSGRFMHGQIAPLFSTNVALLKRSFCSFFRWNLILRLFFFFFQMLYGFRFLGWIMENNFFFFFLELSILRFWDWIKFIYICGIYLETGL